MVMAGLRVGEVAALRFGDVINGDGRVKGEVLLKPEQKANTHAQCFLTTSCAKSYNTTLTRCKALQAQINCFTRKKVVTVLQPIRFASISTTYSDIAALKAPAVIAHDAHS